MKSYTAASIHLHRSHFKAISAVAISFFVSGICCHGYSVELIRNGSFEENRFTGFPRSEGWDDGPGIDSDIGFAAKEYPVGGPIEEGWCGDEWCNEAPQYDSPGPPISGVSGPVGRGRFYASNFGRGNGGGGVLGSATQHIDLTGNAGSPFEFSAWLTSAIRDTDFATITIEFFTGVDATGESLGSILFDGNDQQSSFIAGSANEQGIADPRVPATQDNWTFYRTHGRIPLEARSAAVVLRDGTVSGVNGDDGYLDLVSLRVVSEPPSLPGDYNGNDEVEQADLDLVLLHWGTESMIAPDGWIRDLPMGPVDQEELDAVLLNWGTTQPGVGGIGTVPEPGSFVLLMAMLPCAVLLLRSPAWRTRAISLTTGRQVRNRVAAEPMASIQVET